MNRISKITRETLETKINLSINLDGTGKYNIKSGVPFLDHMLSQISKHSCIDIDLVCYGDLEIDFHHTVEDIGICLGKAFSKAIGDKLGIKRFSSAYAPLDESLSRTVIDISGRPGLFFNVSFCESKVGTFDSELIREFFQGFTNHSFITIHIDSLKATNTHHQIESIFKSFALSIKEAIKINGDQLTIPSTKNII